MSRRRIGLAGAALVAVGIGLLAAGAVAGGTGPGWFGTENEAAGSGASAPGWGIGGMSPGMMGFGTGAGSTVSRSARPTDRTRRSGLPASPTRRWWCPGARR